MLQSNRLTIYAIGKIKKLWIRDGINQYKKRMPELVINELKTFNLNNFRLNLIFLRAMVRGVVRYRNSSIDLLD